MSIPPEEYVSDIWKPNLFANRVVFCTGGAGTICSAQVRALVYLGANACIIGRDVEKTQKMAESIATARKGAKVIGIGHVDVRNQQALVEAAARCANELGGIDILIAAAAGNFLAPITQLSANAFKAVIDIDLIGSYNTVKACLPYLAESAKKAKASSPHSSSRILFVSATLHYTGMLLQTHVVAAKAGVDALSAQCAIELGPRGITSNVISPGAVRGTEGMERLSRKEYREASAKMNPTGDAATVKDIADTTVWLCSDAAHHVNGAVLPVDGGSWRIGTSGVGLNLKYPDFLLSDEAVTGVKGEKKAKL